MKKRVIPCIFLKEGMIVRSEDFSTHQVIGNPINQVARFSDWAVDEIVYIDISRFEKYDNRRSDHKVKISNDKFSLLREISKLFLFPLRLAVELEPFKILLKYYKMARIKSY